MSPEKAISMLARQIEKHGVTVTVRRGAGEIPEEISTVRAWVRDGNPENLAAGIAQKVRTVVLSPTGFETWDKLPDQHVLVRIGDGAYSEAVGAKTPSINDVPVRINLLVMDAS